MTACGDCSKPLPPEKIEGSAKVIQREQRVLQHLKSEHVDSEYKIEKTGKGAVISVGSMGTLYKAKHKKDKTLRAVKQISKSGPAAKNWHKEVELLKTVDHPHICKLYEIWEDPNCVFLVMELCRGGDLMKGIVERPDKLPELSISVIVRQMLGGIGYLHSLGFMHGDMGPEDFLLSEPVAHTLIGILDINVKMADFGICPHEEAKAEKGKVDQGIFCKAPEQLGKGGKTVKVDVWALGVLSFLLLSGGAAPFPKSNGQVKHADVKTASFAFEPQKIWSSASLCCKSFIESCIKAEPEGRAEIADLLMTPWMGECKAGIDKQFTGKEREEHKKREATKANTGVSSVALPTPEYIATSLRRMSKQNALEKAAETAAAHRLPPSKIVSLWKFFEHLDGNGDGRLSTDEIRSGLSCQMSCGELQAVLRGIDTDGSGYIEYTEFITATYEFDQSLQDDILASVFRIFDSDGSGSVTHAELKNALVHADHEKSMEDLFGGKTLDDVLKEIDDDGSGELGLEEFKALLGRKND